MEDEAPENMEKVESVVTLNCNCNCVFCSFGHKMARARNEIGYGYKSKEEVFKDIDHAVSIGARVFCFTGGEPTIRKDLAEMVRYARDRGIKDIQIQSNGRRFAYEDYCREMIGAGITEFAISVHSPREEVNDYLMGTKGAYRQIMKGIRNLLKMGQTVKVSIVITRFNYKDLPSFTKYLMDLGVSEIRYDFVVVDGFLRSSKRAAESVVPRMSDVVPYLKECLDMKSEVDTSKAVYNIPHCMVPEHVSHVIDMSQAATQLRGTDFVANIKDNRKRDKVKKQICKSCIYDNVCYGIWDKYAEIYGTDEIRPVKQDSKKPRH